MILVTKPLNECILPTDRKILSLQTVVETVVQEIQRLLVEHPMLVLATKSAAFGDKQSTTEVIRLVMYLRYLLNPLTSSV